MTEGKCGLLAFFFSLRRAAFPNFPSLNIVFSTSDRHGAPGPSGFPWKSTVVVVVVIVYINFYQSRAAVADISLPSPEPLLPPQLVMIVARLAARSSVLASTGVAQVASRQPSAFSSPRSLQLPRDAVATGPTPSFFSTSTSLSCKNHSTPANENANAPAATETDTSKSDRFSTALRLNKEWAARTARDHPDLFATLAAGQSPQILWLGCSDSRCPETSLLGLKPGDVFVHRNIANIMHPGDLSSGAVIEYAVQHLRVQHVVVCGHTSCGGVAAAMGNKQLGILDPWLLPLRQVRERNLSLLQSLPPDEAATKLVELNVREGLDVVKQKGVVLNAIQDRGLQIHGLIYDVASGVLRQLDTEDSEEAIRSRLTAFATEA